MLNSWTVPDSLYGAWRLTRFQEFASFVIVTTLLGAAAGKGTLGWPLITVLAANWLSVGFAFMVNDVEDAPDDALDPHKARRNPVSAGKLSRRTGHLMSVAVGLAALGLYAWLGIGPLMSGLACLALGWLYSFRQIRLKATPVVDLISHALMLAGLQFVAAYLTFGGEIAFSVLFPLGLVLAISLYGQLFNQIRDFDNDVAAGINHTTALLGPRLANYVMLACFTIGVAGGLGSILITHLVPSWVLLLTLAVAAALSWRRLPAASRASSSVELQQPFQKPLEIGTALALTAWFALPWVLASLWP